MTTSKKTERRSREFFIEDESVYITFLNGETFKLKFDNSDVAICALKNVEQAFEETEKKGYHKTSKLVGIYTNPNINLGKLSFSGEKYVFIMEEGNIKQFHSNFAHEMWGPEYQ